MVLDALNSTLRQDYEPVELIICDDCSQDNTVRVIEKWIADNRKKFLKVNLIVNEKNLGTVKNRKRALAECSGEYIKGLPGDDILGPSSLKCAVQYFKEHPESIYFHGQVNYFHALDENKIPHVFRSTKNKRFFQLSPAKQYEKLLVANRINAFAVFFRSSFFSIVNIDNFRLKYLEDLPNWLVATAHGFPIRYTKSVAVYYRVHEKSVQRNLKESGCISNQTQGYYKDCIRLLKKNILNSDLQEKKMFIFMHLKKKYLRFLWALVKKKPVSFYPKYKVICDCFVVSFLTISARCIAFLEKTLPQKKI